MRNEPAVIIGIALSALLYVLFGILYFADAGLTDDLTDGSTWFILALCAGPAVTGLITRAFVYAPETVDAIRANLPRRGTGIDSPPSI